MKSKMQKVVVAIVIIAVLLIPVMYSFFYLKAYWDPYGNLKDIKIAMVNDDKGKDGENQGEKLVNTMIENGTFTIQVLSDEEAENGLKNCEYYAIIKIPENFSNDLGSAGDKEKQISKITYSPNQKTNYLASQIINSAIKTIELNLQSQVAEKVTQTLVDNLNEVPNSLAEISDGTNKLLDGAQSLNSGLNTINNGVGELKYNYELFDNGIKSADNGSKALGEGINQVDNGVKTLSEGSNNLDNALDQINNGANVLSNSANQGINDLTNGIKQLSEGTIKVYGGTQELDKATNNESALYLGASQVADGLKSVEEKAPVLINGTNDLTQGISQLNSNMGSLVSGANAVNDGLSNYIVGLQQQADMLSNVDPEKAAILTNIINQLKEIQNGSAGVAAGVNNVSNAVGQLNSGAQVLNSGVLELGTGIVQLSKGSADIRDGIELLNSNIKQLDSGAQALNAGAQKLSSNETSEGLKQLVDGTKSLQTALVQVKDGATALNGGVSTLKNGTQSLKNGSKDLENGLDKLSNSSNDINGALNKLKDGTEKAYNGSSELTAGIQTLKDGVDSGINDTNQSLEKLIGLSEFANNPVEIVEEDYGKVEAYGLSFTPLFLSIGLWVGCLMLYVVIYYDLEKRFSILGKYAQNKFLQIGLYFALAIMQGVLTGFILKLALGFTVTSVGLYYFSCILIACVFLSIIQFLIMNFGDVGKFIGLIILVLQLAASGGTFPVETVSKGFQKLNPFLPMTYTIRLVKESIISRDDGFVMNNVLVLILYLIIPLVLTLGIQKVKMIKTKEDEKRV